MGSIIIRRLDDDLKTKLRLLAAKHGRSMEQEAREILKAGLTQRATRRLNLAEAIRKHIEPLGGIELVLPPREPLHTPPKFHK